MTHPPSRLQIAGAALGLVLSVVGAPQAAFADSIRDRQWHLAFLDVTQAHQYSQGAGVTVAVIDTGVDGTHPDLTGNVLNGTEVFLGNKGGNGWTDEDGHGTRMAGEIAAHGHGPRNRDGALGIAPMAQILPVRDGPHQATATSAGILWAIDHGARVISLSTGGKPYRDIADAVARAESRDVVVVAAAGNRPESGSVDFPAAYPGVVAVGGVDQDGNHADFSVTGSQIVLSAPAVNIYSTGPNGQYHVGTGGTSDATAIVAGAVALVRSKFPNLSAAEVIHRLTATAIDKGPPGRDDQYGYGVVNLVGALTADVPPLQPTASATITAAPPATATPRSGGPTTVWLLVGLGVLVVAALATVALINRRRRPAVG